ncbi:MAG: calcium/sodium antiporter [bacterium]
MTGMVLLNSAYIVVGLVLLYLGGHFLVSGAAALARRFNVPVIVIGLTVVAFGTSAPELFVSLISAWKGLISVSVGNVVGSNIINVALILGLTSLVRPMTASRKTAMVDTPVMLSTYGILALMAMNHGSSEDFISGGAILRWEGILMIGLLIVYLYSLYRYARNRSIEELEEVNLEDVPMEPRGRLLVMILKIVGGAAGLALGGQSLVDGASWIAENTFGASERFVGITIVALGTSLPELITSMVAVVRKEMDISLGNIIGSNIFNSLMVLGATAIIRTIHIGETNFVTDFSYMVGVGIGLFALLAVFRRLPRWGGALLFASYGFYLAHLIETRTI